MATVNISVDTSEKKITVEIDGEKVGNVAYVSVSNEGQYFYLAVEKVEEDSNSLKKRTVWNASAGDQSFIEKLPLTDLKQLAKAVLGR